MKEPRRDSFRSRDGVLMFLCEKIKENEERISALRIPYGGGSCFSA